MYKITSYFAVLCLLPVIACDPGGRPADAAAAFPGLTNTAVAIADAPQETIPTVARRVWGGPEADIFASPSPDGRFVSITDWQTGDLAVRNLETGETRRVTDNPGRFNPGFALYPRVSPDGERIAYAWFDMQGGEIDLRVVSWDGSEPRALVKGVDMYPQAWSPDGRFILAVREREDSDSLQLVLVGTADGAVTVLKSLGQFQPRRADFSADGRFVAYDQPSEDEGADQRDIFVVELAGGRSTRIVDDASHDFVLGWAPDGEHLLYSSDRTGTPGVWLLPVSGGRPTGDPALVLPDAWGVAPAGFLPDGRYMYGVETEVRGVYVATLGDDYGSVVTPPSPANRGRLGATFYPTWSPDGQYIAYGRASVAGMRPSLAVRSLETGEVREFQLAISRPASELQWAPDGQSLLGAVRDESGLTRVYRIDLRTGRTEAVSEWSVECRRIELSPDGRFVYYTVVEGGQDGMSVRVFRKDLVGGSLEEVYGSAGWVRRLVVSPDGSSLAASLQLPEHQTQVVIFPAAGGEVRELTPIDPRSVISLAWTPDGKTILYARQKEPGPTVSAVEVLRVAVAGGEPEPIGLEMEMLSQLRLHPDGRRLAFVAGESAGELWVMKDFLPGSR